MRRLLFDKLDQFVKRILPLLLLILFILLVGKIIQMDFTPLEGSIALHHAKFYSDNDLICEGSIPDELAYAEVFTESMPEILTRCVKSLKQKYIMKHDVVQIPHEWRESLGSDQLLKPLKALYSFNYTFTVRPQGLWGIALPSLNQNAAVFLNSKLLGWTGSFESPVARNATRPQLLTIPDGEFREGDNEIDIYIVSEPARDGFLGSVHIAPAELLKPAFEDYYRFRYTLPWIIALVTLVLSFSMLILWIYRPNDTEYGLFSLVGFLWAIHTLDQFIVNIPVSIKLWDGITYLSAGLLSLSGILFIHRLSGMRYFKAEKKILAIILLIIVLVFLSFYLSDQLSVLIYVGGGVALIGALYVLALSLVHTLRVKKSEWFVLTLSLGIIFFFSLHDLMITLGIRPFYEGRLLHFGAPFLLLSFMWIMLLRFVATLQAEEKFNAELIELNRELENKVTIRGKKIAQSYETIRILEREQLLLKERSRIMRDMHDGIGVYLNGMLRQLDINPIDRKKLSESAHNALNDLRLMIDSMGSASSDLPAMLGMFRTRITTTLDACRIDLIWDVDELPSISDFGPERALNLLRILQEAFTNALKHSGATSMRLQAYSELDSSNVGLIKIEIHDNGCGFVSGDSQGNGLDNMRHRARKINAKIDFNSDTTGTTVCICFPA